MNSRRYELIHRALKKLMGSIPLSKHETRVEVLDFLRTEVSEREVRDVVNDHFDFFAAMQAEGIVARLDRTSSFRADMTRSQLSKVAKLQYKAVTQALRERRWQRLLGAIRWRRNSGAGVA